ncbi:LOW QUALITY PROTEIN: hypothetical protein QYF61_022123 [Mycteria americana]|uniref:CCHC-type domain-containing protein n=1 Tax=Mycteria americana TaxID=33587 RepID=A0AAN7MTJ5_MYCAM|nr:LOW QUALITY PROTEIN: hypothetical protein QYF61_022123 [Mycteria americana]
MKALSFRVTDQLRRKGKWDEVSYVDLFFTLRNHLAWQKQCGVILQDPMILASEKQGGGRILKRWCLACSTGKRCLKCGKEEDDLELMVAPRQRFGDYQAGGGQAEGGQAQGNHFSPIAGRTRARQGEVGEVFQAPFRQAVGNDGPVIAKVPFSITDLRSWKETAGIYREDPEKVAKVFEIIIRTQDPDWNYLQVIMDTLLDSIEKRMVLNAAQKQVEGAHANGDLQGTIDQNFPTTDPEWDPNQPGPQGLLTRYQRWIYLVHAMPKAIHWSKLYEIKQEPNESPSVFIERLKVTARKYTNLDPEKPEEAVQLAGVFMGQSAPDIRRKLQKLEGLDSRDLGKKLEVAWTVFNNREKEKESRQAQRENLREGKLIVALIGVVGRGRGAGKIGIGRGRGGPSGGAAPPFRPPWLAEDQCAVCKERGHWKKECPKVRELDPSLQAIKLMTLNDED